MTPFPLSANPASPFPSSPLVCYVTENMEAVRRKCPETLSICAPCPEMLLPKSRPPLLCTRCPPSLRLWNRAPVLLSPTSSDFSPGLLSPPTHERAIIQKQTFLRWFFLPSATVSLFPFAAKRLQSVLTCCLQSLPSRYLKLTAHLSASAALSGPL